MKGLMMSQTTIRAILLFVALTVISILTYLTAGMYWWLIPASIAVAMTFIEKS